MHNHNHVAGTAKGVPANTQATQTWGETREKKEIEVQGGDGAVVKRFSISLHS